MLSDQDGAEPAPMNRGSQFSYRCSFVARRTECRLKKMNRQSKFSYLCNQCGRCCHDKVITLSPYDVLRLARAAGISTGEAVAPYTIRRGSILKFKPQGGCAALARLAPVIPGGPPHAPPIPWGSSPPATRNISS